MKLATIHQAKTHLSRLIQAAERGEEVVIAKGKRPVVRLQLIKSTAARKLGWAKGRVRISKDFDAPLKELKEYM